MMLSISIRQANTNDIASLASLMSELGYATTNEEMSARFSTIAGEPNYQTFVADFEGEVVGMAGATRSYYFEMNGCYVRLVALVVKGAYRNNGIGKALIEAVGIWAKEVMANAILLNCGNREERAEAHAFYERNGFQPKSTGYIKRL